MNKLLMTCKSVMLGLCLFLCGDRVQAQAAVLDLQEIGQAFESTILAGEKEVSFETSINYTMEQIQDRFYQTALGHSKLYTREYSSEKLVTGSTVKYTFHIEKSALVKVKVLNSKAAVTALKKCDYSTKYYSETSYYRVFELMLMQHPEYNYNTLVWHSSNGSYGYHRSKELSGSEQNAKMKAASKAAKSFVRNRVKNGMTAEQKLRAIHDYLIESCAYDYRLEDVRGYEDSATAYGALVEGKAICQGYAGAFNLLASHAGILSLAVCGKAGGDSHAWNYVKLNGRYRYVDCTWDDTLQSGAEVCYDYFNVSADTIRRSHSWKKGDYSSKYLTYCKQLL